MDSRNDVSDSADSAQGRMNEDVENLKGSFSQLRHDVVDLLTQAFGLSKTGAEAARDGAHDVVEALKKRLEGVKDRGAAQVATVEKKIEENPISSALIAFGIGYVVAKLLSRRR